MGQTKTAHGRGVEGKDVESKDVEGKDVDSKDVESKDVKGFDSCDSVGGSCLAFPLTVNLPLTELLTKPPIVKYVCIINQC